MTDRRYVGQEFEFSVIRYEKSDYRATITFNRPDVLCAVNYTELKNSFGSYLCRAIYFCNNCTQPFEQFKPI